MAYYTGTVNSFTDLRQALLNACVAEGWAWHGSEQVLERDSMFLHVPPVGADYLGVTGRTSVSGGDMPSSVGIGTIGGQSDVQPVVWPATYEVFEFPAEVYCVIHYAGDRYQWLAFGRSTVQGLPGTGMWVGGTRGATAPSSGAGITISPTQGGISLGAHTAAALFWATWGLAASRNCWVHSDLDGQGWLLGQSTGAHPVGIAAATPLIGLLPNSWNSEAVLLPVRGFKARPANKVSLTADLEHARYARLDYYEPGQVLVVGADRWKVFPWYRKNAAQRDGGQQIDHTGTFGWAIRYEGP